MEKITQGTLKRKEKEQKRKEFQEQQKKQKNKEKEEKELKERILGEYKRTVIDSFLIEFTKNYGSEFDYNSLVTALTFDIEKTKDGFRPNFLFDVNKVRFQKRSKKDFRNFNINQVKYFSSEYSQVDPNYIGDEIADGVQEKIGFYTAGYEKENLDKEGEFIPTSTNELYGEFNKINKILGYSPVNKVSVDAQKQADTSWKNIQKSRKY